jgi:hypothetical protein
MTFYRTSILLSYTLSRSISKGDWHGEETPFLNRYPEEGLLKEWLSSSQNWIQPFFHPVCVYCLYNWMSAALPDISGPVCPQRFPFKTRFSLVSAWGFLGPCYHWSLFSAIPLASLPPLHIVLGCSTPQERRGNIQQRVWQKKWPGAL